MAAVVPRLSLCPWTCADRCPAHAQFVLAQSGVAGTTEPPIPEDTNAPFREHRALLACHRALWASAASRSPAACLPSPSSTSLTPVASDVSAIAHPRPACLRSMLPVRVLPRRLWATAAADVFLLRRRTWPPISTTGWSFVGRGAFWRCSEGVREGGSLSVNPPSDPPHLRIHSSDLFDPIPFGHCCVGAHLFESLKSRRSTEVFFVFVFCANRASGEGPTNPRPGGEGRQCRRQLGPCPRRS